MSKRKEDRQQQILRELAETPTLRIGDMARTHGVSTETIRRDLDELTRRGVLNRTYGGAVRAMNSEPTVTERHQLFTEERERIARRRPLYARGQNIYDRLRRHHGTCCPPDGQRAAGYHGHHPRLRRRNGAVDESNHPVIVAPGVLRYRRGNDRCADASVPQPVHGGLYVTGASGIAADGPSEALIDSGTVYRAMIQRAAKSIVVADHSKFDLTYPYHYAGWSGISRLITDQPLPDHLATVLGGKRWSWRVVMPLLNSSDPRRYVYPLAKLAWIRCCR